MSELKKLYDKQMGIPLYNSTLPENIKLYIKELETENELMKKHMKKVSGLIKNNLHKGFDDYTKNIIITMIYRDICDIEKYLDERQ